MKKIILGLVSIFLLFSASIISCKDEDVNLNRPPIANAGADRVLSNANCNTSLVVLLDGTASSDPDNDIAHYNWTKISGPSTFTLTNATSAKAKFESFFAGAYAFELVVTDEGGRKSSDTVLISATGPVKEYDLDISLNGSFIFRDNYEDCYYGPPCSYYDWTTIQSNGQFPPIGGFNFYVSEFADTATSIFTGYAYWGLNDNTNTLYIGGTPTISFKKLIQDGGGPFSGTFQIQNGSAQNCQSDIYNKLPPLSVTGTLDIVAKKIDLSIKGKVYF